MSTELARDRPIAVTAQDADRIAARTMRFLHEPGTEDLPLPTRLLVHAAVLRACGCTCTPGTPGISVRCALHNPGDHPAG